MLTPAGQTVSFLTTVPVRNDPVDPATRSFNEIMRLLDHLPPSFPFRGTIIGAVPRPVQKVGPLELDPVSPMSFGFQWGVKPVFDLKSIGPPIQFAVGGAVNARYVLKLVDKPGATVPQLGLFVQGDFRARLTGRARPQNRDRRSTSRIVCRRHPRPLLEVLRPKATSGSLLAPGLPCL